MFNHQSNIFMNHTLILWALRIKREEVTHDFKKKRASMLGDKNG